MSRRRTIAIVVSVAVLLLVLGIPVVAEVVTSECDLFPTEEGWLLQDIFCDPEEWNEAGSFFQFVVLCEWAKPPTGQQSFYRRFLADFVGTERFFLEFKMETNGDRSEMTFGAPANLALGSQGPTAYNFTLAKDLVQFRRDSPIPSLFFDIEPGVPHTYRVELFGDALYILYIDGAIVDQGVPVGPYPSSNPSINFGSRSHFGDNTSEWHYFRLGDTPTPASGDYDSDSDIDSRDYFYFAECVAERGNGPDVPSDPGCTWADMDADGDVDFADFARFQRAFTGEK